MSYTPPNSVRDSMTSMVVSPYSREGMGHMFPTALAPTSATYASANTAYYYQIVLPGPATIRRFWWLNGATASTNNIQVGLYRADYTSVLRGTSTLASGANAVQYDDVTDTVVGPGKYYLAIWANGTTTTLFRNGTSYLNRGLIPFWIESSLTGGLPSTMTPAAPAATGTSFYPVFGFTQRASP